MPEIRIRTTQNSKSDLEAFKALMQETFDFHAQVAATEPSLQFRPASQTAYLEDCLWFAQRVGKGESPNELALLAFLIEKPQFKIKPIEKPVGLLMMRIQEDYYYATRYYGYVEQLIVTATARNLGIGKRLLDTACNWLRSRQIDTVTLKVYGPNEDALHFYEREGFHPLRHELVKHF